MGVLAMILANKGGADKADAKRAHGLKQVQSRYAKTLMGVADTLIFLAIFSMSAIVLAVLVLSTPIALALSAIFARFGVERPNGHWQPASA